jgi:hypothetical protein
MEAFNMKNAKTRTISRKAVKQRLKDLDKERDALDSIPRRKIARVLPVIKHYRIIFVGEYSRVLGPTIAEGELSSVGCKICGQISPVYLASWPRGSIVFCMLCGANTSMFDDTLDLRVINEKCNSIYKDFKDEVREVLRNA